MIYLLTAIGLTPGSSSTVHIYTQTVHRRTQSTQTILRTTQLTNWKDCGACLVFARRYVGRDSSVSTVNRYELDGPEIDSRWRQDFPHSSRPAVEPRQPPIQWVTGLSRGAKRPGRDVDHPPLSCAEVVKRVELYMYYPSGPPWSLLG